MSAKKRKNGYTPGFVPPTAVTIANALGTFDGAMPAEFGAEAAFFGALPKPRHENDWLAHIKEDGQTFEQFLDNTPWLGHQRRSRFYGALKFEPSGKTIVERFPGGSIYLQPVGAFGGDSSPSLETLAEFTSIFFGVAVKLLEPIPVVVQNGKVFVELPSTRGRTSLRPVQGRVHKKSGSRQLGPDGLISVLKPKMPADALFVVGVTMEDLYLEASDLFVAGWAGGNDRVGVFSFHRYDPGLSFSDEHWWNVERSTELNPDLKAVLTQRCCKLLVHEAAHIMGVEHCIFYDCIMNGSGHLEEDFRQSMHLCPVDLRKLQALCGFDVVERYRRLLKFYETHKLENEAGWTRGIIESIAKGQQRSS